jgi:cytoskeletal protein RodZ
MANYNDNDLEDLDFGENKPPEGPANRPSNRNFLIALGIIGGIFVIVVIALLAVVFLVLPARNAVQQQQFRAQAAANTATAQFATDQALSALLLLTPSATPVPSATPPLPTATNTPVVAPAATKTPTATSTTVPDAQKATLSAQQTQLAAGKFTTTVIATSTALPTTGFADQVGLPGLLGLGAALILIVFLARRMRMAPR